MSKELTEKWKNGKLEDDVYYVKFYTTNPPNIMEVGTEYLETLRKFNGTDRAEVLAPVPSYEELQKLKERIADADKTINYIILKGNYYFDCCEIAKSYLEKWGVK